MESKLLIIAVIILGVIAVTRLMKVYDLSSKLGNKNEAEISERHNRLNANLLLLFCASLFIGFLWLIVHFGWSGRGPAASAHGHGLDVLYNVNFAIVLFVFFLTHIFLFYFAFKYVRKPGVKAYYFTHSNKLEVIWTAVPAVVLFINYHFRIKILEHDNG